jgi:hypothetical protein
VSDIFLSYSSADRDRVAPIAAALERLGWRVWWDRRILAGQSWDDVIAKALEAGTLHRGDLDPSVGEFPMGPNRG